MIRQEDVKIEVDDRSNIIICDRQFLGREYCYELLLKSGQKILVTCPIANKYEVGTGVTLELRNISQNAVYYSN